MRSEMRRIAVRMGVKCLGPVKATRNCDSRWELRAWRMHVSAETLVELEVECQEGSEAMAVAASFHGQKELL